MSTQPQVLANRKIAHNSTGPTSAEGKRISSAYALRHGLTASSVDHFPAEVREEYAGFRIQLEADMLSGSNLEQLYFKHFAFAHFLALRAQASAAQKALTTFREFQSDRYHAVLVQDELTHELNLDVTVPISAPLTKMLKPGVKLHDNRQAALCVIYAEARRQEHSEIEDLQNEPNPIDEQDND